VEAARDLDERVLVFVGTPGAGHGSAARAAAAAAGVRAVESDVVLEQRLGSPLDAYFAARGERALEAAEEEVVAELLADPPSPVLAMGGGAIASERVREALAAHTVVLLDVDADRAWRGAGGGRPPLRDRARFEAQHLERAPLFDAVADAVLLEGGRESVRRAVPALRGLADAPPGTRLLWATTASAQYPVYVGEGLLRAGFWPLPGRRFVITDGEVGGRYAIPEAAHTVRFEGGEAHKTLRTVERLLEELASAGMARDDHLAALGGGVVGDIGGFCAAVYQRGVGVVQVPTTLLAQVDSAYGGKTGVDLPQGKNYVGAFHQPAAVLADTAMLATLPAAELAAGWAEVIKTALIAGGALWKRVRHGACEVDRDLVFACARTKLAIVAEDERDDGRRQALNLGHTVGHAIETATGYARYRHGEAVGLGLLAALRLSERPRLRDEVAELLRARGLPVALDPAVDLDAVRAAVGRDKKRRGGRVGFVLLDAPGDVRVGEPVPDGDLRAALEELRAR